jgi:hypothetical protein
MPRIMNQPLSESLKLETPAAAKPSGSEPGLPLSSTRLDRERMLQSDSRSFLTTLLRALSAWPT